MRNQFRIDQGKVYRALPSGILNKLRQNIEDLDISIYTEGKLPNVTVCKLPNTTTYFLKVSSKNCIIELHDSDLETTLDERTGLPIIRNSASPRQRKYLVGTTHDFHKYEPDTSNMRTGKVPESIRRDRNAERQRRASADKRLR